MPVKIETTHVILERQLIIYRRSHSGAWQCRYKCDGHWQRGTTKETDLKKAIERAKRLLIEAEIRKEKNLPVITRRFRDIGRLAIDRMKQELEGKNGKVSFTDYSDGTHLISVLETLKVAVETGELDAQVSGAAEAVKARFAK